MEPFKKLLGSRKFWVSILTAVTTVVSYYRDPELAKMLLSVGLVMVSGLGLEDFGKAKAAIESPGDEE
jgi:hypothetical protein